MMNTVYITKKSSPHVKLYYTADLNYNLIDKKKLIKVAAFSKQKTKKLFSLENLFLYKKNKHL